MFSLLLSVSLSLSCAFDVFVLGLLSAMVFGIGPEGGRHNRRKRRLAPRPTRYVPGTWEHPARLTRVKGRVRCITSGHTADRVPGPFFVCLDDCGPKAVGATK